MAEGDLPGEASSTLSPTPAIAVSAERRHDEHVVAVAVACEGNRRGEGDEEKRAPSYFFQLRAPEEPIRHQRERPRSPA